ncbi:putative phage tail protein [Klebsiella pneumoniae]|uniref:phage tail tip fiber protein n=2 Tax=Klebsiella pneumoniae TaxID=573 RepID=UPI000E2D6F11|nr:phage tail protein [Klebsiella pneumoniae]MDX7289147.1 phage tail protein [Klebsiella pneumoniae]CAA1295036.1 ATPase involved in DNA repair [Klebsiella pneumoniae]SWB98934.1 putative phage tail protein [Klebsiella pneumoniae]SWC46100.1 putative phage tail protein [Klebsiella pneumoniae]SXA13679.1 putative phage tail protein [Klebsiella pneumoniae]
MDQFKKKRLPLLIAGAGGKKSSGSSRTPVEADDTVNSRAMASILDLLGEGVVGGLINGAKSIFIDGVALENEDGSFNYSGVTWDFRDGSQDQSPMPGFDFVETPKAVNTQLKTTNAVTVAIDNDDADRVRVIMKFPSLRNIDKKTGDTNGTSVQFKFQLANGNGSFYDVIATGESSSDVTLTAKKTGVYYRSYEIQLPKPGRAYKVRVLRLSADSNDQYLFNDTWVDSIGEIVDTPMNYPNSVLVGLKVNSEQFGSSMPSRSYLIRGLKIRVPSNYDENTNTYNGVWDGTFKLLSSSNPAWILFDLLTNARYGLGKFVSESMIDLGQLYQIGRYCDEEVDDGFGGKEKRFAINTQITSRQDAYRLIQDIAGAFRGMVFWAGGMVNIMQDSPSDPVMLFTNANVKDGLFTYKGSARKDRPSVALITYNNKQDGYKQNVEYVEDQEAMARYGERKTEAVAFGCTSRGQAHRVGLWLLYTARMESDMITFTAGLDASFLMPGETVLIQNKYRAGKRNSGRIVSFTKNSITLDAPVSLKKSGSFIRIINQEGKIVERDINETGDNITKVTFKTALATADQPVANGVWTITEPDLVPMRARVVAIAQGETPGSFDITVVQNNASKYQAIDNGATLVPENTTVLDPTYSKPSNLVISEGTYLSSPGNLSVKLMLAWEGKSPEYWVSWRRSDEGNVSNWQSARATEEQYEIVNVAENGRYDFQLYSVSFGGKKSEIITAVYQVKGTMTPPGAPTSLTAVGDYRNVVLNWVNPDSVDLAQINVYASKTNKLDTATLIAQAATTTFTHAGLGDNETWYYWIRAVNKRGMVGQPNSNLGTEATTRDVLSFLKDKITSSELGKELLDEIDSKATQEAVDNAIGEVQNSVNESIQQVENDLAQTSSEIKAQVDSVNQSLKEDIDTVNQTIVDNIDTVNQTINTNISNVNSQIEAAKQSIKDGDAALSQEIKKAQSSLTTSLSQTSKDLTAAIQKETNDRIADVNDAAKQAADQLLSAKNELKTSIDSLSEVVTSGDENLARQISQIAAGTGEQFDSLKIWYFDQDAEGWTEDDNGYTPMSVTSDGWLKANNPTSTCRSPNGLTIDAHAYRFIKMRIKKVGNPTWNAKMFWIGADETGWNAGRSVVINEPEYDDKGIAILTLHDIEWRDSTTIRRFRFDFTSGQDADNYLLFDWIAVGRPTPGAGMAALQEEQQARANADTAEAQARSTLAAQIRGSSESGNLDDIRSGLIYQEKNARITADAAEASARESLQTEFNRNKASVAEELHTLSTEQASQASKITGLQTSLGQKADASAVQTISQKVEEQGNTLKSQGAALSTLDNRVGSVESGVSANSKAITGLQSTVTQQDKTLSSQSESITTLNNSLSDIQSDTDTAKSNPSNLLVNASFERDLAGWSAGNSVSSVIKASAPHSGSKILVCAAGTVQIAQSVSVVEGRTYKLSSFVRCTTDAVISSPGNNKLRIGAATLLKEIPIRPENLPKDETWKEVSDTWKATLTGKVDVSIMSSLKTGSQYFDDVGFVDVTDALAIEANASATNALTSRVSSVEGTITSQGQQITSMQNSIKNKADASAVTNLTNRVTAAENQISSQSQSITSLSNSLDNANADADASKAIIGNMLKNNSFERGFEGWEYVGWTLLEAQNPKSGKYIIQAGKLASGGDSGCNQTIELQAGKTYRIGAWVRKSADFAINNAGNNKISLRNADLTPIKDIPITGAGLSTNWALISGEYTPAKTASVVVSLRASVASGYMYLDDVFCVDVSNEKAIDATSNALSTLNSTVTQQGKDITSNSNSITSLSNQMVHGRQNMWVRSVYNVQLTNNTTEPTFSDINGKAPISIDEVPDAAKLDFASAGSYVIAHYKAFVKVNADTTITMAPGSRVFDDTGAVYVNGVRAAFGNSSWNTVSFDLKAGWSTIEFLVNQWTGQAYINLGFKLSEKVAQLNSALGMNALSNAISAVTSNVSTVGDRVTSTSQSVTDLRNSLEQTNANLANKADAQALSTLQNTVSKQGDTISSQGNSITNLNNTLTAARNAGDNLIPNYDFLQGATAWDIQYPAGVTFGNFGDGKAGVKLNRTTTTSPGIFSNNNKPLPLNGQRKYRVVVKAKGVSGAMNMLIRRQNKIGQTDSNYEDKNVTLTSEWQTITWETGLTASNADGQNFKLYAHPANAEIWVDTFKVFDITDEVKIKANSDALSTLSSTVTQQGDKITSQGNSITKLTNDLEAADANIAKKADQSAVTTLTGRVEKTESGLTAANSNITSLSSSLNQQSKRGANLLPDGTFESYAVGHNLSNNRVIVTTDDSHGGSKCIRVTRPNDYNANATDNSDNHIFSGFQVRDNAVFYMECWVKLDAKSTAMAENAQISIGLSLQYQDNSWQWPAVTKAAKELSTAQWTKVSGYLKSTKSGIKQAMVRISIPNVSSVKAGNSFLIDDLVITEVTDAYNAQSTADANANAISTLDSTVSQQGDQITSQGNSITKLTNDLATTNNNVSKKADQSALSVLSGRVDQTESGLSSANSSITALNSSVRAGNATSGDLISNPTFDPEFSQMGFTVVSSSSEGVPANCPYAYVARIAARDHHPNFAAIPATLGDVYEMSALVACGAGSADFNLYLGTATRPSGSVGAPLSSGGNRKASATWQRVTWRFKITQGIVDRGFFRPFLQINQSSPFGTVWYVTDWHLRNVTDSSKVQDSLDATAKAVDSLTSTVNQQGENISSIGTRTTNLENNLRTTNANVAQKADANALTALTNRVTQTEKDINSTSSSVTNLNNKVDAISVGGTNLIKNSGDMTGWSNVVSDTYRGNAVIGATVKAGSGYKDLREITLESPVDAGEYVYSFYAKGGVTGQTMTAFFYNPNTTTSIETNQGAKGSNSDGRAQFTLTTSWARYWVKWKQTPTTGTKRLILCRIESNTSKDQTVYINSPKFEVGNVVSDWNESPSDSASASAVDSLTTKVNQQGTSISSIGNRTTSLENGLSTAQNNIAKKADASALQDLRNTVTSQGGDLTAANSSITSLQASMNRRTVFTVTARGNGNSVTPGVFDESGKNLFTPGRSWALVTFAKHSDGSTVIATSKTYDVFGSANNGATMSADIEALASGTYVCVLTFDEPTGNRGKVLSALESLGGTSEVVNSLPYRGAYILLGRKGMKPGDGLELRAPTGGDGTAHISTSVEFVNGVMMGLGAAGGVMMKADANASAITTLQNTVKTQGDNIDSLSSSTTALENSLASSNASVDAASQIPGNLIVNPSFERGTEGYTGWSGIATVVTLQVPHLGTKAAKLAAGGSAGVGQKISFKKDRSYKIGIWAKQDPNTTIQSTDNTKFRVADGTGLIASKAYGPFTSNWQEVSWTWKATKDVIADVQFTAFLSAGAMYFDDFYVVDVTDSVETQANSSAITKLDSRVTKTENDITSQGSQVTQLKNDLATTNTNVSKKADAAALTGLTNRVTQNEKEIETQSSQTTSLKNSLSTVQAMGSNPWFDGSLETYSENQQISGSRAVVVSSQKRSGTKSLRVSRGAGEGGNSDKSIGKWIALRENAVFRIELWAMMPADQSPSSGWSTIVGLQTQNAANNNNWPSAITITEGSLGGRGTWKKFTGTLRVATGHTRGVFWISTRGTTGTGTPGYDLYIDDVVVTDITDAKEAQDSANANASALTSLTSRVTNVEGQVTSQASQLSSLTSQVNDASSKVDQMAQTITNNEKTQSSLNTSLQSQIDAQASANIKNQTELNNATTSLAAIKSTQQTQATTISALSQQQTNLTAQVGGQSAELQELKKTVVENGNVNSTWMVKMETNSNGKKYAAGIALGIDGKNLQSQFLVQADRFGLINTSNGNTTTPFVVENGVAYMNAAVIKDGSITNAKIGSEIRSDNFVDGSRGWRVGKDGSSQFHNVIVRGHVEAESGSFKGTIDATDGVFRGTVQASRFVGDICSAGVFKQGVRPDITHYDSGSVGGTKTYVVSGTVACDVNFVGRIMVWIKGVKVSEFSVGAAASNATTRYIPAVGSLSGVTDQNVRCEITVEGSGIYNYVGGFALMTRSSGSWA